MTQECAAPDCRLLAEYLVIIDDTSLRAVRVPGHPFCADHAALARASDAVNVLFVQTLRRHCGCCGRAIHTDRTDWCADCAGHVGGFGPPWERTYAAVHDTECPYQIGVPE